jgi:hypothetical protein
VTHILVDVPAAEDDIVIVDEPDIFVNDVTKVRQAAASLVDEEANGLRGVEFKAESKGGGQSVGRPGVRKMKPSNLTNTR